MPVAPAGPRLNHRLRPEKTRQHAEGPGFESRHLHPPTTRLRECPVLAPSGHRSGHSCLAGRPRGPPRPCQHGRRRRGWPLPSGPRDAEMDLRSRGQIDNARTRIPTGSVDEPAGGACPRRRLGRRPDHGVDCRHVLARLHRRGVGGDRHRSRVRAPRHGGHDGDRHLQPHRRRTAVDGPGGGDECAVRRVRRPGPRVPCGRCQRRAGRAGGRHARRHTGRGPGGVRRRHVRLRVDALRRRSAHGGVQRRWRPRQLLHVDRQRAGLHPCGVRWWRRLRRAPGPSRAGQPTRRGRRRRRLRRHRLRAREWRWARGRVGPA